MRFKAYRQLEHSDCGITCVRMIAQHYGRNIPLNSLRKMCDAGRLGVSLRDIIELTKQIGFKSYAIKIKVDELYRMPLPAILYWNQRHYVVLYDIDIKRNRFYLADPDQGKLTLAEDDFMHYWRNNNDSGLAIISAPTDDFYDKNYAHSEKSGSALFRLFRESIKKYKNQFIFILLFTLISMLADVALPLIFQRTIDEGIAQKNINLVWLLALGQLCIFIGNYVASNINNLLLTKMGLRVSIDMLQQYLIKLINLPISFFDRKVNSDFIQKIEDQNRLKNFLVNMPETIFLTTINLIVFSAMLIYYSIFVYLIFIIATGLSFIWTRIFLNKRREIDYSYFNYQSENRNNIYELVNGMSEIKINNAQHIRVEVWNDTQKKINQLSMKSAYLNLSINGGNTLLSQLKDILIIGICATLVINGDLTLGAMMTVNYIAGRLTYPFNTIISSISTLQDASISYERLDEIINSPDNTTEKCTPDFDDTTIKLCDVSFKYPGSYSPYVLNNITVTIPQSKTTAIVGASGCGKTTLIKLLLGFYVPQSGNLTIGGTNVSDIDINEWLSHCGVVSQNGYIFSGTILENIALSDSEPDENRAKSATQQACLYEFIEQLPMGFNTKIGVTGIELSGGQKQRLFIARALYKQPTVLFLDEATSSLDAENEKSIVENITKLYSQRTIVIAAHRLSTVKNADNIIYMEHGRIIEQGSHSQLIAKQGAYFKLVKNQLELDS